MANAKAQVRADNNNDPDGKVFMATIVHVQALRIARKYQSVVRSNKDTRDGRPKASIYVLSIFSSAISLDHENDAIEHFVNKGATPKLRENAFPK